MLTCHINSASANLYFPTTSVMSDRACTAEPVTLNLMEKRDCWSFTVMLRCLYREEENTEMQMVKQWELKQNYFFLVLFLGTLNVNIIFCVLTRDHHEKFKGLSLSTSSLVCLCVMGAVYLPGKRLISSPEFNI